MDFVPIIVVVAWCVSLCVAIFVVPKLAAKRAMENFGLVQVESGGKKLFVPVGTDGEPVRVPIGTKKKEDGTEEVVYGYSTLPITLIYMVASETANAVKYSVLSAKGKLATQLNKAGFLGELKDAGIDAATVAIIESLPAKVRPIALLVARALKGKETGSTGQSGGKGPI